MNKYITVLGVLLIGITIGWWSKSMSTSTPIKENEHIHTTDVKDQQGEEVWTCSMHPQIRQPEFGICAICEMDLIPLDNSISSDDPSILKMSKEAAKLAQIETFLIEDKNTSSTSKSDIYADGTIEMDERTIKSQTAHLNGRVESMNITFEGQYVKKGQKIAQIYSVDLLAASQELITASKFENRMDGILEASMQKLRNWKITTNKIDEILKSGQPISTIDIFADHSGYILDKIVAQGDYIQQGEALYTVGSTAKVWLVFQIFESDINSVGIGSKISFTTSSSPNKTMTAAITYIDPVVNNQTRTVSVRAEINNRQNTLKPGMILKGFIKPKSTPSSIEQQQEITIPNSAILWTGNRSVVYAQMPDMEVPTFQYKEVVVAFRGKESSTIESGLNIGDNIVTHGAFVIDASAQLNNKFSMMNKDVQIKKEEGVEDIPQFSALMSDDLRLKLDKLISQYISLKDALVATNPTKASLEADLFEKSLDRINMANVNQEVATYWMMKEKALRTHSNKIKNDNSIDNQRKQFNFLSELMILTIKAFGTNEKTYFVQHCPMADNNEGADWISMEEQIQNPYFGDKMMKCGFIKLELN